MASLSYAGRTSPMSDDIIATKSFADNYWASVKVDTDYIDANMATLASTLTTQTYVDSRDATRAKKTYVTAQDNLAVPTTQRGANGGVAPLNASVQVPVEHVPAGILTDRVPLPMPAPTLIISGPRVVLDTGNALEFLAATIEIADPGFPYIPLITGQIMGAGTNENDPGDGLGMGVYGQALVIDSNDTVWARAVTASNYQLQSFPMLPWALASATPTSHPPISGPTTLSLYLSLYSRSSAVDINDGYTFTDVGLVFGGIIMPGM